MPILSQLKVYWQSLMRKDRHLFVSSIDVTKKQHSLLPVSIILISALQDDEDDDDDDDEDASPNSTVIIEDITEQENSKVSPADLPCTILCNSLAC